VAGAPTDDPFGVIEAGAETSDVLASALRRHPHIADCLDDLHRAAWDVVDPMLLELCRLRIAQLLGCEPEQEARTPEALAAGLDEATVADLRAWPTSSRFGSRERACLAFCEQFVIDVAGLSDDLARAVSDELGPAAFVDFVNALLIVEQRQRLRLAWERLLISSGSVQ
jgi:alkylhydroperoxidase family enzyme